MWILGLLLAVLVGVTLGFFGGGGSILTVPLLVYVFGLDPKTAIASSLVVVAVASLSGAWPHARAGNVRLGTGLLFGSAGMAGAYLGGRAGAYVDGGILLLLFATMMALTSVAMWQGRRGAPAGAIAHARAKLLLQGFGVGLFTGLVGAGGGFLIVPALNLWAGLPVAAAVGTSLIVIVLKSGAALLGYLSHVSLDVPLVAAVTACAVGGSALGSRLGQRVDPNALRRAFASFVLAMAVLILAREGALVVQTLAPALPASLPQLAFALALLAVGLAAGRASRRPPAAEGQAELFQGGEGI